MFIRTLEGGAINVSRHGQRGLAEILEEYLKRIEWDNTGAVRLMPMRSNRVVIDLNVSGGQPTIKGTGVLASILAGRWRAGDSYEDLARGYTLPWTMSEKLSDISTTPPLDSLPVLLLDENIGSSDIAGWLRQLKRVGRSNGTQITFRPASRMWT